MKPWLLGPNWTGVDKKHDNRAGQFAADDSGVRRDRALLESLWPPSLIALRNGGVGRGLYAHRAESGAVTLLEAVGRNLYANGTALRLPDGTTYALSTGTLPVRFSRSGYRTFLVDGASALHYWDERDPSHVYPVALPEAPAGLAATVQVLDSVSIDAFSWSAAGTPSPIYYTAGSAAGWYALNNSTFPPSILNSPLGGFTLRVNSDMCVPGDQFYKVVSTPLDLSDITGIAIDLFSGGNEEASGTFLALILGTDPEHPEDAYEIPLPIAAAKSKCHVTVRLDSLVPAIPDSIREAVKFYGFRVLEAREHVVWFKNFETIAGATGDLEYKAVTVAVQGSGEYETELPGLESEMVSAAAGSQGAKVTLTSTTPIPDGWVRKWYRRIKDLTTAYRYVGTQHSGDASFEDQTPSVEVVTNPALKRNRAPVPVGAHEVFAFAERLLLVKGQDIWFSEKGNWTTYLDVLPAEMPDLVEELAITESDACRVPLLEVGKILAVAPLGAETGSDLVQDAAILTQDWIVRLTGDGPSTFHLGYRREGGVASPSAWCNDKDGNLWRIDRDGDVIRLDRTWSEKAYSEPIEEVLHALPAGSRCLAYDPITRRLGLFANATDAWVFDTVRGGWDKLAAASLYRTPVAGATAGTGDTAYAVIQGADGGLMRLFDPAEPRAAGYWHSRALVIPGNRMRAVRCFADAKDATVAVWMDGELLHSFDVEGESEVWENLPIGVAGRAFEVRLSWQGDGFIRTVRIDWGPWGRGG